MHFWKPITLTLALLTIGAPAFGAGLSNKYEKCLKSTDTNSGWAECSAQEIKRQEARLSDAWRNAFDLMKKVSARGAQMLLEEQRAWVKFKDTSCTYFGSGDFGREGQVLRFGDCKARIIAGRVKSLQGLASDLHDIVGK